MNYELQLSKRFHRQMKKYLTKDKSTARKITSVLDDMSDNPFDPRLRTHKVYHYRYSHAWSTRVTGDIRIIWDFYEGKTATILILETGKHDEVYQNQ